MAALKLMLVEFRQRFMMNRNDIRVFMKELPARDRPITNDAVYIIFLKLNYTPLSALLIQFLLLETVFLFNSLHFVAVLHTCCIITTVLRF